MHKGLEPLPEESSQRPILSLQKGEDGRLRLLPRPPPPVLHEEIEEAAAAAVEQPAVAPAAPGPRKRSKQAKAGIAKPWLARHAPDVPKSDPRPSEGAVSATPGSLIDFRSVTVRYGTETALADISLEIAAGELVALVGVSGAGKTTALRLLQGLLRPTEGRLWIDGVPVHRTWAFRIRRLRRRIGVVHQDYRLLVNRSALENVAFALQVSDLSVPRAEVRRRAVDQLALVGLAGRESARPDQLSGGQQQRLAIARALVAQPRILLADEPTASLDAVQSAKMLELFKQISDAGTTVVLATHDLQLANGPGVRLVRLRKGRLVRDRPGRGKLWVIP